MSRQHAIAALVFVALATGFTWPLALNLGRAVAEPGDAYVNIWILDWDWWATLHQPLSLFHANMLHPAKYSLAFTENLYGIALLLVPFRAAGVGPIVAYNLALIAGLALAGFGAYLLGSRLTRSFEAGLAAGIFFAFARLHFTHLQHIWSGWLPLMLVALLDYAERPTRKRAVLFAALLLINGLTNIHYFLFGTFAIAVTALLLMRPRRELLIAVALALLLLAPFLYPYAAFAKLYNLQRTYAESVSFSATPIDWIASKAAEPERHIAPGALALIVAGAAFVLARREWPKLALAMLWIAIGFAGSLGMNFEFHRFLFGAVPGFRAIRVPARWSVIAYIGLAILIALTTAAIARRFRWIVPLAFAIALWQAPIRWYMVRPQFPEVYRWLATRRGPIAELPMGTYAEYEYHLFSTSHHLPSVNGSAGTPVRRKLNDQWSLTPLPDDFLDTLVKRRRRAPDHPRRSPRRALTRRARVAEARARPRPTLLRQRLREWSRRRLGVLASRNACSFTRTRRPLPRRRASVQPVHLRCPRDPAPAALRARRRSERLVHLPARHPRRRGLLQQSNDPLSAAHHARARDAMLVLRALLSCPLPPRIRSTPERRLARHRRAGGCHRCEGECLDL